MVIYDWYGTRVYGHGHWNKQKALELVPKAKMLITILVVLHCIPIFLQKVLSPSGASNVKVDHVMLTTVPSTCLSDPSITVCEYDQDSYPTKFVDTVLQTYHQEMRVLLKYAKPTMLKVLINFIITMMYICMYRLERL